MCKVVVVPSWQHAFVTKVPGLARPDGRTCAQVAYKFVVVSGVDRGSFQSISDSDSDSDFDSDSVYPVPVPGSWLESR